MAKGLGELARLRPAAFKFFNLGKGVWANVIAGLKAQCDLELARLADAAKNGRLSLAKGQELLALAASEFDRLHDLADTKAVGDITLERVALWITLGVTTGLGVNPIVVTSSEPHGFVTGQTVTIWNVIGNNGANGTFKVVVLSPTTFSLPATAVADGTGSLGLAVPQLVSGTIPKGTRFRRNARVEDPFLPEAFFETPSDLFVAVGAPEDHGYAVISVPIVASLAGAAANTPLLDSGALATTEVVDSLFDPLFSSIALESAGGSDGASDQAVAQYAKAFYLGQYAPTDGAVIAGAFGAGARHIAFDDPGTGTATIAIADSSWASSTRWASQTRQSLYDNGWVGFGGSVDATKVVNKLISVTASIVVSDQSVLFDTSELVQSARLALVDYLDNRLDWYAWNLAALRGLLSRLDRKKILDCLSIEVRDSFGNLLLGPDLSRKHYILTDLHISFLSPT